MASSSSYAIWPSVGSLCDKCQSPVVDCPKRAKVPCINDVKASLHVNIWKLTKNKFREPLKFNWLKPTETFVSLDIGVRIEEPKFVEKVNIFVPGDSSTEKKLVVTDLSPQLKNIEMLSALFNDDVSIKQSVAQYQHKVTYEVVGTGEDKSLAVGLNNGSDNVFSDKANLGESNDGSVEEKRKPNKNDFILYELTEDDIKKKKCDEGVVVQIAVPYEGESPLYLRVRLDKVALDFCSSCEDLPNSFLQSCFSKVDITNFQMNEFRTLHKRLRDKINKQGQFVFDKVNMFYICNSDNDLLVQSPSYDSCRYLETDIWKDYINNGFLESGNGNGVLAYHWKFSSKGKKKLNSFSVLVKKKLEGWNWSKIIGRSIFVWILAILFGISTNIIYEKGKSLVDSSSQLAQHENVEMGALGLPKALPSKTD